MLIVEQIREYQDDMETELFAVKESAVESCGADIK